MHEALSSDPESRLLYNLDKLTRFASEDLARTLTRRAFLRRAGATAFILMAGLAGGRWLGPGAAHAAGQPLPPQRAMPRMPVCTPPGPYCNYEGNNPPEPNACRGAHCFQHFDAGKLQQCHLFYSYFPTGCWTNAAGGGYWTCCDCRCTNGATCGCAQFSLSPSPVPTDPLA
jgi:hypothetical protein